MRLTSYQKSIVSATGCHVEDAEIIERYMRCYIVGGPLDGLSRSQFNKAAREAFQFMQEEEAKSYRL